MALYTADGGAETLQMWRNTPERGQAAVADPLESVPRSRAGQVERLNLRPGIGP